MHGLLDPESSSTGGKSRDWPTPNQSDGTAGHQMGAETSITGRRPNGTKANVTLPGVMAKAHGRGVLSSHWVLQLMGYPSTWCDVPGDSIAKPSKPPVTASSRKSSRRSGEPSSRRKE
jgi:hypothetical protein